MFQELHQNVLFDYYTRIASLLSALPSCPLPSVSSSHFDELFRMNKTLQSFDHLALASSGLYIQSYEPHFGSDVHVLHN